MPSTFSSLSYHSWSPFKPMILSLHQTPSTPCRLSPNSATHNHQHQHQPLRRQNHPSSLHHHNHTPPSNQPPPQSLSLLRFHTDYQEKLHYLRNLGLIPPFPSPIAPSRESIDRIFALIDYLKSHGILDTEIPKLATTCPQLFTSGLEPDDISSVFEFLRTEVGASLEESNGLILRCPQLLFSSVEHRLRPTLMFLRSIGLEKLNSPNHQNAHLLNMPVSRLVEKIEFLMEVGFSREEAEAACGRMRALLGYSIGNCLRPKYEYLVGDMGRGVEELKAFPQYFGFSLMKRIVPRHLHLKKRGVRVSLRDMLVCGDDKFYDKWK